MQKYEKPTMEIILFSEEDIIVTSGGDEIPTGNNELPGV